MFTLTVQCQFCNFHPPIREPAISHSSLFDILFLVSVTRLVLNPFTAFRRQPTLFIQYCTHVYLFLALRKARVEDSHPFDADLDPLFHLDADPDPTFHLDADADPDPHLAPANLRPLAHRPIASGPRPSLAPF
jgi:hypothetical protein